MEPEIEFEEFVAKLLLPEEYPLYEEQKRVAKALFAMDKGKTTILALLALFDSAFEQAYGYLKQKQLSNRRK